MGTEKGVPLDWEILAKRCRSSVSTGLFRAFDEYAATFEEEGPLVGEVKFCPDE